MNDISKNYVVKFKSLLNNEDTVAILTEDEYGTLMVPCETLFIGTLDEASEFYLKLKL